MQISQEYAEKGIRSQEELLTGLLQKGIGLHKDGKLDEAERMYQMLLNRAPAHPDLLYLLSDIYLHKNYNGLAMNVLGALLQRNPKHAGAWCNLGCAFRKENEFEQAKEAWFRALEHGGETEAVCSNFATLYADRGNPQMALPWIERALKLSPDEPKVHFGKSLALLGLKQWEEGWKEYEWRRKLSHWDTRKAIEAPLWDGNFTGHLYLHGEQGVGDEIMFASAIPALLKSGLVREITLEVNAKVAGIMKQTWPQLHVVKATTPGRYDAKMPIGSLMRMFGINNKPYLKPHKDKVSFYRRELEKLGPGPYVALAWVGGMKETRTEDRSIVLGEFAPLMKRYTCVSTQYHKGINECIEEERIALGLPKINDESSGEDLHDQAALLKAVDAVVTVQQTAVHVAGSVGAKTLALIGSMPHWRYGIEGNKLPWYSDVTLYRKKQDWTLTIERLLDDLDNGILPRAERRVA